MPIEDEDWSKDPAYAPLAEAGEGVSEGFELAEQDLIEHATHGDERDAGHVVDDAFDEDVDERGHSTDGEADNELPADLGEPGRDRSRR